MKASASKRSKSHSSSVARSGSFFKASRGPGFFSSVQRKAAGPAAGGPEVQAKLSVSKPADPLEKEADRTADKVMRMTADQVQRQAAVPAPVPPPVPAETPKVQRAVAAEAPQVQRMGAGGSPAAADTQTEIQRESTGGQALPAQTRAFMEPRLNADLGDVRVHTDETAASLSNHLSARAFTYRNHVFFARDQFQPGTEDGQRLLAHELTHTIQQGATVQRSAAPTPGPAPVPAPAPVTTTGSPPAVQRLGIQDALDYFADKAAHIPGWTMLTLVLGFNPINMRSVSRSAANFLRALIQLVPGGALITRVLDTHGVIGKAAEWVEAKVSELGDIGSEITGGIDRFLDSLSWRDIFSLGSVWDRAKRIFTGPIGRLISFGGSVVGELLGLVKDAILRPLAALAEGTAGYDLLKAVLGEDPITGDPVPQDAEALIGGFMKLIGQEEVWQNIKKGNAIARAYAWFQGALAGLLAFVRSIPGRILATIRSLTFEDVVTVVGAFRKIVTAFAGIAAQFGSWALGRVISLLEILFSVVAPGVMPYIAKARAAFQTILRNPVAFVGNLVRAGRLGFQMFAGNIVTHLKTALIKWLVGPLAEAGVYIPKSFTLVEIIKLVLSVLGLTWQNIRTKLLKIIPEPVLAALETTASILVTLVTQGPVAAWEQIKVELEELKGQLISQVTRMVQTEVVKAAVTKLVSMINPAGAVIQAIVAIYNTITFFIEKARAIGEVIGSFINSIAAIAAGQVGAAAKKVEQTMANTLVVVLAFLAKFAGLGGIPAKVVGIVQKVRAPIDKGLDRIVAWLGGVLKMVLDTAKAGIRSLLEWWKKKVPISGGDKPHTLTFKGERRSAALVVQSAPLEPVQFMTEAADQAKVGADDRKSPLATTSKHAKTIDGLQKKLAAVDDNEMAAAGGAKRKQADADASALDKAMAALGAHIGATLAKWKVGDEDVTGLTITRGSFTVEHKRNIRDEAKRLGQSGHLRTNAAGEDINVEKGYARRHVVSAHDMGQHYMGVLNQKKVSAAKLLLEERGSITGARTPVAKPPTGARIKEAAVARYTNFFGYAKNLFLGDSRENSSIQEHLDKGHPEMAGKKLRDHVARIKRGWALDDSFTPSEKD